MGRTSLGDGKTKRMAQSKSIFDPDKVWQEQLQSARAIAAGATISDDLEVKESHVAAEEKLAQSSSTAITCSTCEVQLEDRVAQTEHYKLDWHRFNLKQRLCGQRHLTEEQFEQMLETEEADQLSISGSDDEEEKIEGIDEEARNGENDQEWKRRHPRFFFQTTDGQDESLVLSVYKCILRKPDDHESDEEDDADYLRRLQAIEREDSWWGVLMLGGGHFAGAVFNNCTSKAVVHKTFHCYTVRAKQGGSQSSRDAKGGHPKSAGASLRRYNEAALVQHVQDLLKAWRDELARCNTVFFRAAGAGNKGVLFGGKDPPLKKGDPRLQSIPFPTRRATFTEVKRVHEVLSSATMHGTSANFCLQQDPSREKRVKPKKKMHKKHHIRRSKSREIKDRGLPEFVQQLADQGSSSASDDDREGSMEFETVQAFTTHLAEFEVVRQNETEMVRNELQSRLLTACKLGNLRDVHLCLDKIATTGEVKQVLRTPIGRKRSTTLLHVASAAGHKAIITFLLSRGADPSLRDGEKKVPYNLCPDRDTRNVFRVFRGEFPDAFDYSACQIPPPATPEEEERQRERKKAQRENKREKERQKKRREAAEKKDAEEKSRYLALSDREKCALAAERRILSCKKESGETAPVLLRCFQCASDISGQVPFEYSDFKFCSPKCVREHRQQHTSK